MERPCPSCGTKLKVNAERLNQKLQCPKCMSVFVLESIPVPAGTKPKKSVGRKKRIGSPSPAELESRYRVLLSEHVELANRYEQVVASYEQVLDEQAKLADQIRRLSP